MSYTIYDIDTGLITSRVHNVNQIRGRTHVAGNYDPALFRIVRGQPVALPPRPALPSHVKFKWNSSENDWMVDVPATKVEIQKLREKKLQAVDRMNPVWWQSLDSTRQQQVVDYRKALLDITDQPDYPINIVWPVRPAWL